MTTTTPHRPDLRDFYENPAVPVASGPSRTLRQARILATALGPATQHARTILDIGCGDGTAAATAAPSSPATGSSASTGPRTPSPAPAPTSRTRSAANSPRYHSARPPPTPCCSAR